MAVKSSDLANKMSGANLQMDGHVEMPTQIAKAPIGAGGRGWFPLPLTVLVSSPEATVQSP